MPKNFTPRSSLLEIEMKFALSNPERLIETIAKRFGVSFSPPWRERDVYLQHPARDFVKSDEALRLRQTKEGLVVTYKGPKQDQMTKQREEIELPLFPAAGETLSDTEQAENRLAQWGTLFHRLGFCPAGEVIKFRRAVSFSYAGFLMTVTIDHLEELGDFAEIETLAPPPADGPRAAVMKLASDLNLTEPIRSSYLNMVLRRRGAAATRDDG